MITPYISFAGQCLEAIGFYEGAFSAAASMVRTYGDYVPQGVDVPPSDLPNWILHAEMEICGTKCWLADEVLEPVARGTSVKLSASVPTAAEARTVFAALSAGGRITLPPTDTFYSAFHAGVIDKYGVCWNIVAEEPPAPES